MESDQACIMRGKSNLMKRIIGTERFLLEDCAFASW